MEGTALGQVLAPPTFPMCASLRGFPDRSASRGCGDTCSGFAYSGNLGMCWPVPLSVWKFLISVPFWCFVLTTEVTKASVFPKQPSSCPQQRDLLGSSGRVQAITLCSLPSCARSFHSDHIDRHDWSLFSSLCPQLANLIVISSSDLALKIIVQFPHF